MPTFVSEIPGTMPEDQPTRPVLINPDKSILGTQDVLEPPKETQSETYVNKDSNEEAKLENGNAEENPSLSSEVASYDVIAAAVANAHAFCVDTTATTAAVANEILPQFNTIEQSTVEADAEKKTTTEDTTSSLPEASNPPGEVQSSQALEIKTNTESGSTVIQYPKVNDTRKLLQCPKCPSTFYSRSGYYRHTKKCGLPLEKAAQLRKMNKLAKTAFKRTAPKFSRPVLHPSVIREDKESSRITYQCPKCPSDFFSKSGFYKHIKRCKAAKAH